MPTTETIGFPCPVCAHGTEVRDSRGYTGLGGYVRRRRRCLGKKRHTFTTYETTKDLKAVFADVEEARKAFSFLLEWLQRQ